MRHQSKKHTLGKAQDQRKALLRSLATELFVHGEITTTLARAKALAAGRGWEMFDVYYDVNSDFKRAMNVSLVPHIFIFDKNGNQIYTHVGYKPGDEVELFKIIQGLK